jgi:hypothetical protein
MELAPAPKLGGHVKLGMEWGWPDRTAGSHDQSTEGRGWLWGLLQLAALKRADPTLARTFKGLCGR